MAASQSLREVFLAFREQSIWTRRLFNTFQDLFHPHNRDLRHGTAAHFFHDLNEVLLEYFRLQACKLTDPAESFGRESLTVCNLNEQLEKEGLLNPSEERTSAIKAAAAGLMHYRKLVKPSRDKTIAHQDKAATLANEPIGAHSKQDVIDFLAALQTYNDEVGHAVGEGASDFKGQRGEGDAITLLQHLRVGLHVRRTDPDGWNRIANGPDLPDP